MDMYDNGQSVKSVSNDSTFVIHISSQSCEADNHM